MTLLGQVLAGLCLALLVACTGSAATSPGNTPTEVAAASTKRPTNTPVATARLEAPTPTPQSTSVPMPTLTHPPSPTASPTPPPTTPPPTTAPTTTPELTATPKARPDRPNIILINTDDLDAKSVDLLPQVQSLLAEQGASFSNSFVSNSLCCPSRATLLRGQYTHNHQVLTVLPPLGGFKKFNALGHENSTVATWLQDAGYRTALFGKYLNGYGRNPTYVPPGWDEWYATLRHYFRYRLNENGKLVNYGQLPEDYETDVLTSKMVDFIHRNSGKGPFFMYAAPFAPHLPAKPAPRHEDEFEGVTAPRVPSFNEEDVSDKPAWVRSLAPLDADDVETIDNIYRKRLQSMLSVEDMVAMILAALESVDELDQTYIIFTSDNGILLGEHRRILRKSAAYDESIRVPLIIRGPGIRGGRILEDMVLNNDLAPTVAELAGVPVPDFVDGRSLAARPRII